MKTAILTGISGQDGAYLAEFLLKKNYRVIGLTRNNHLFNLERLDFLGIRDKVIIEECDLTDLSLIIKVFEKYQPHEIYNLAAQSSVSLSFKLPIGTLQYNILSIINILEASKIACPTIKVYQASSSEMFGAVRELPIRLTTPMHPLSPYAISKATGFWTVINYRESYNLFATNGVLFNHESYLRGNNFFVKKVISDSIKIKNGELDILRVGNIEVKRDFGYAPMYVEAMWLMLQNSDPVDFMICSGESIYLRDIINYVFDKLNISNSKIKIESDLYRPTEIKDIYGDNTDAKNQLNWKYDLSVYDMLDILVKQHLENGPLQ